MSIQYGSYRKDIVMFFSSIHADYTKMGYPAAIVRALDFLKNTDLQELPGGRHAIEGDMMYANVDDVETKLFETTKPESHKNYIDIQFMVKGQENMGFFVDRGRVKPIESYPERDCYFYPNESVDDHNIGAKAETGRNSDTGSQRGGQDWCISGLGIGKGSFSAF